MIEVLNWPIFIGLFLNLSVMNRLFAIKHNDLTTKRKGCCFADIMNINWGGCYIRYDDID